MKTNLFVLFCVGLLVVNCSQDSSIENQPTQSDLIIGDWQLNQVILNNFDGTFIQNFNRFEVLYTFNIEGQLEITSTISEVDSEVLDYSVELDCLSSICPDEVPQYELLFLNGSKNELRIEGNSLHFGQGYLDGPSFVLERLR